MLSKIFSKLIVFSLTHWGRVMHIYVSKLTIIGSDNGLLPGGCQAIIRTNDGILLIRTFRTNFSEIFSEIHTFSFKKMPLKMLSAKWRQFCLGLNVLKKMCTSLPYHCHLGLIQCWLFINSSPPGQNGHCFQTIFSDAFSWMKSFVFWLKFHRSLFLSV